MPYKLRISDFQMHAWQQDLLNNSSHYGGFIVEIDCMCLSKCEHSLRLIRFRLNQQPAKVSLYMNEVFGNILAAVADIELILRASRLNKHNLSHWMYASDCYTYY